MAKEVMLLNPATGLTKTGYVGFSWTTLFFGFFPPLFRCDFVTFVAAVGIVLILALLTYGIGASIAMFIWAFMYNRYYTRKLISQGYKLADNPARNALAAAKLGVSAPVLTPAS
jgi:hypothetical protein